MNGYEQYWHDHGLETITPRGLENPEGFDLSQAIHDVCRGSVLEIGCGTGRIARHIPAAIYTGVDINPSAIEAARKNVPTHDFRLVGIETDLPYADTAILYTVCLHIPDSLIEEQLIRATAAAPLVVIAEIMNPKYRRASPDGYNISNQRSLEEYTRMMSDLGFDLVEVVKKPYAYYSGEEITFASFAESP